MASFAKRLCLVAALLAAFAAGSANAADAWPSKPLRIMIPYGVGSGVDVATRTMADQLAKALGQPVLCENRTGGGGAVAAAAMLALPADGHALLTDTSAHTITPALNPSMPFDTVNDFVGVTSLIELPIVLVASPAKGFKSIQDILTAAKASPGRISYASAGVGTSTHLALEKLRLAAGVDFLHVPYKSTTDAMVEVMSGRIDILYTAIATAQGPLREGRLVPFAMIPRKVAMLPDVPAVGDVVPGASLSSWVGVMMSSKVPREIVDRLNREIVKVMNTPDMRERFAKQGTEPWTQSAEAFEAMRKREIVENAQLVKAANIKP